MKDEGWLKLHRQLKNNPVVMKDGDHLAVWIYILLNAVYESEDVDFEGKRITLRPGQFTTGRKAMARALKIDEHKIDRILERFKSEHQIEQQMSNRCRLITVLKWSQYQKVEHQSEQKLSTNKEIKNTERIKNTESDTTALAIAHADIVSVFDIFKALNPMQQYGNKTHRKAVDELVKAYGLEKIIGAAKYAVSVQNEKYAPVITNPYQLKSKFGELIAFKARQDKNGTKSLVAEI